jgi:hypothetical protein
MFPVLHGFQFLKLEAALEAIIIKLIKTRIVLDFERNRKK